MAIVDSKTGRIRREYSVADLEDAARMMRGYNLVSLCAAGSGHAGGTLSIMDITAALYLRVANHDPEDPSWEGRDRIVWSAGHKAPSLYVGLGMAGFFDVEDVVTLRKLGSPFQGHPHRLKLDGIEASTGSLGQGQSIAVGMALAARLEGLGHTIFTITGDGEQQEGQVWEAVMEAGHFKLDNLVTILDKNRLQIDGWVDDVMSIDPIVDKYRAFGWEVFSVDGHDMAAVIEALESAVAFTGKPALVVAETVKGKGVSFMEDVAGWHGKAPDRGQLAQALDELGVGDRVPVEAMLAKAGAFQDEAESALEKKMPAFGRDYWWNRGERMKVDMDPTRKGFGRALDDVGDDERIVCVGLDISDSITISDFHKAHPERKGRFINLGIAEQSGTAVAAGLAREGKLPVFGTYGCFASGRNLDQIRTTVCYGEFNVFIAGAHGGVSVGPDGATHQALEELFQMCGLPNMNVIVPCDSVETRKATAYGLLQLKGPKYVRFAREATPVVTTEETPFIFGKANVIRYRGEQDRFIDAFETALASSYSSEGENLSILACGPMVPEAMRAAVILKEELGVETRVVNIHTVKPIDEQTIIRAASETGIIVTAEEHQIGGFGDRVAGVIARATELFGKPCLTGMIGVKDRFGESGAPWELIKEFEVSAEHIAAKARELYDLRKESGA